MAFPTLASLDAALVPALADSSETGAIYRDSDGNETTGLTVLFDEVELDQYTVEGGQPIQARRFEMELLRSQVNAAQGGTVERNDGTRWTLMETMRRDASRARFIVRLNRAQGT